MRKSASSRHDRLAETDLRFDRRGNVTGWTTHESWTLDLQNSKEINVFLDIRRNFAGDWSIKTPTVFEKLDATKIKFLLSLKSRDKTFNHLCPDHSPRHQSYPVIVASGVSRIQFPRQLLLNFRPCFGLAINSTILPLVPHDYEKTFARSAAGCA